MPGAKGGFLPFPSFMGAAAAESEGEADLVQEMIFISLPSQQMAIPFFQFLRPSPEVITYPSFSLIPHSQRLRKSCQLYPISRI